MNFDDYELEYLKNVLPDWAKEYKPDNTLQAGRQLCTKDGRRVGNAFILNIEVSHGIPVWLVLTDAGNLMKMEDSEVNEFFHIGLYIANIKTIPGLVHYKYRNMYP